MDQNSGLLAPCLVLSSVGRPEAWTGGEGTAGEPVGGETRERRWEGKRQERERQRKAFRFRA